MLSCTAIQGDTIVFASGAISSFCVAAAVLRVVPKMLKARLSICSLSFILPVGPLNFFSH